MNKQLARELFILTTPEVQEALEKLMDHRWELNCNSAMIADDPQKYLGAARENKYLKSIRDHIIEGAK